MVKYFSYAIGENILVVLGILIALQINNIQEYKKELQLEQKYLSEIREDLISATVRLNVLLRNIENHIKSAEMILDWIENGFFRDSLSMTKSLYSASFMYHFDANLSTYNEMINSGNLNILNDKVFKDKLDGYNTYLQQIETRYESNKKTVWYDYRGHIRIKYLDGRLYSHVYSNDNSRLQIYPIDWDKMRNDMELRQMLSNVIGSANAEKRWHFTTAELLLSLVQKTDSLII